MHQSKIEGITTFSCRFCNILAGFFDDFHSNADSFAQHQDNQKKNDKQNSQENTCVQIKLQIKAQSHF